MRILYSALTLEEIHLLTAHTQESVDDFLTSLSQYAHQHKVWLNTVDQKAYCDFITPALVDRDPLVIAISTAGKGPMLGRQIRKSLETQLDDQIGDLLTWAGDLRPHVNQQLATAHARRLFWGSFFSGSIADLFYTEGQSKAAEKVAALLQEYHPLESSSKDIDLVTPSIAHSTTPSVSIVGVGPGDPKLLTLEAIEVIEQADVILVDRLVDARILKYARREAQLIYVGKNPRGDSIKQSDINQILVREAHQGHQVVRLKSGDPMIFGRVVDELSALQCEKLNYRIIPGLSAAQVGAARLAIPLTRRGQHRQCVFATGRTQSGTVKHPWTQWAQSQSLFALYMSAQVVDEIQGNLLKAGFDPQTPVTVVSWISRPQQQVKYASLSELSELVHQLSPDPMILYIGAHPYAQEEHEASLKESA